MKSLWIHTQKDSCAFQPVGIIKLVISIHDQVKESWAKWVNDPLMNLQDIIWEIVLRSLGWAPGCRGLPAGTTWDQTRNYGDLLGNTGSTLNIGYGTLEQKRDTILTPIGELFSMVMDKIWFMCCPVEDFGTLVSLMSFFRGEGGWVQIGIT